MWWVDNVNNRLKQALQLSCCCWSLLGIQSNTQAQLSIENNTNFFLDSPESTKYAVIMAGPSAGERRVVRGGSWFDEAQWCACGNRQVPGPGSIGGSIGFRVALDAGSDGLSF